MDWASSSYAWPALDSILSMAPESSPNGHHLHQHVREDLFGAHAVGQTVATFTKRPTRFEDESIT